MTQAAGIGLALAVEAVADEAGALAAGGLLFHGADDDEVEAVLVGPGAAQPRRRGHGGRQRPLGVHAAPAVEHRARRPSPRCARGWRPAPCRYDPGGRWCGQRLPAPARPRRCRPRPHRRARSRDPASAPPTSGRPPPPGGKGTGWPRGSCSSEMASDRSKAGNSTAGIGNHPTSSASVRAMASTASAISGSPTMSGGSRRRTLGPAGKAITPCSSMSAFR